MARSTRRAAQPREEESVHLALRMQLMDAIAARIERLGLSQAQAAEALGITAPRMSLLAHGRVDLFSLDALVELAARLDLNVRMRVTRPYVVG